VLTFVLLTTQDDMVSAKITKS